MRTIFRFLRYIRYRLKKAVKGADYNVLIENIMEIREAHLNICLELDRLKNKITNNAMIETICVTACEMEKMGKALKKLRKEGF